ncbi:hypothetical protein A6A25_14175 [Saccharothrix sp. CB00851]|nr:hypothetical protein A6A25_14175 [Saccharothrix sp. CB00851]
MAAEGDSLGVRGGRGVERAGGRCAPVGQQRLVVALGVEQADPADVDAVVGGVDAAEAQVPVRHVQAADLLGQRARGDFAVPALLVAVLEHGVELGPGGGPFPLQPIVQEGDPLSFGGQFPSRHACPL